MNLNPAHWHLLVNHLSITGGIIFLIVLAYGFLRKARPLLKQPTGYSFRLPFFRSLLCKRLKAQSTLLINTKLADLLVIFITQNKKTCY